MYALRDGAQNNAEAKISLHDTHINLRFFAYLPEREATLLESYAWPQKNISDKLGWIMPVDIWGFIKPNIEGLGIKIVEEIDGQIWS